MSVMGPHTKTTYPPATAVCSDCDGTGVDEERRPDARHYLHPPSSLCRECGGRGVVEL